MEIIKMAAEKISKLNKKTVILIGFLIVLAVFSYGVGYGFGAYMGNDLTQKVEQLREEQELLRGPR